MSAFHSQGHALCARIAHSMNIGLLTEMMNVGGASAVVLRQARWLKAHGHSVVVLSAGGALLDELTGSNIPHITMTSFEPGKQFTPEQLIREGAMLQRAISEYHLDCIVAQAQWPFPFAAVAAAGAIPVFLDLLSPVYWVPKTAEGVAAVQSAAMDGRIIATAVTTAQAFGQAYAFDPRLAHITNVPIQASPSPERSRAEVRKSLGIDEDEFVVITVARLDADRAPMILPLARAVEALSSRARRLRCVVIGDGTHAQALRAQAPASTVFTGFRRDLADLYHASDLFCGEGSVVQDAAAAGLPSVITCATVYPQLADRAFSIFGLHIVDHFFVAPSSVVEPVAIQEALSLLLENAEQRNIIARAGKSCFEAYWAMDPVMTQRLGILANRHQKSGSPGACEAVIEIEGGASPDVQLAAALLAEIERPERFGIVSNAPVPWARLLSMPIENAQALSSAAHRVTYRPPLTYRLRSGLLEGRIIDAHADLERVLRGSLK